MLRNNILNITCSSGVGVSTLNLEVTSLDDVSKTITKSAGFVIGSPTLGGHMPTQVCLLSREHTSKAGGAEESAGH
jgi:flavorubredoxin